MENTNHVLTYRDVFVDYIAVNKINDSFTHNAMLEEMAKTINQRSETL